MSANSTLTRVIAWAVALGATAVTIAAVAFYLSGGRWFIVETPSMATAAPVGTLVVTQPVTVGQLDIGDVISFHPPTAPDEVYTHRVVGITASGIVSTRGDLNGTADPWELRGSGIIGRAVSLVPVVGWVVRAVPMLAIGLVVLHLATRVIRSPTRRSAARVTGASLLVTVVVYLLKPFVSLAVLGSTIENGVATASVVSTGILPIRVAAVQGGHVDLVSGQLGTIDIPTLVDDERYKLASQLHLDPLGWFAFAVVCALPLLWVLVVGLPPTDEERTA